MIISLRRGVLILAGGVLALAAIALPVQAASSPRAAAATGGWRVVKTISERGRSISLLGIDAVSRSDAWVDGFIEPARAKLPLVALIEHWNGSVWRRAAVPAKAAATLTVGDRFPFAVSASSAANVWVFSIGRAYLHLTATGWHTGSLPKGLAGSSSILDAKVFGPSDVWVFGDGNVTAISASKLTSFAAHFNGRRWSASRMPTRGGAGPVSALSEDDMWAITGQGLYARHASGPRVARWNGKSWQLTAAQPSLPRAAMLYSILALSNRDVWVAGSAPNPRNGSSPFAEHWNGRVWQDVSPPAAATSGDVVLTFLVPDGSGGIRATSTDISSARSTLWHYARGVWTAVRAPGSWPDPELAAVPHSTSTWAISGFLQGRGLILLHGPIPR